MKKVKLRIPIGELFQFLGIDNDLYESFQPPDRYVAIKDLNDSYVNINHFVKKQGYIYDYELSNGSFISCDMNHKVKQLDGSFSLIKNTNHVVVNGESVDIIGKKNKRYGDVYDVSLDNPHTYKTSNGVECHNTTAAKILTNAIDCDYIYINASDERNVDTIRNKVKNFASSMGFKKWKVVVLDEADYLNPLSQAMLRNLMETFSDRTRFILTCNYVEKVIEPIQSRCQSFKIEPPSKKDIALHMVNICKKENLEFNPNDIKLIIDKSYPDIRKTLGMLQQSISNGKINTDGLSFTQSGFEDNVIELLKSNDSIKNRFTSIRKLMMDEGLNDYSSLISALYSRIDEYGEGNVAALILVINEAQYKASFVVDQEINISALIIKILEIID